ncbi:MAG: hypothetical protein ABW049_04145 [Spongiibacteraceae bacterium]
MTATLPAPWRALRSGELNTPVLLDRLQLSLRRSDDECWLDYRFFKGAGTEPVPTPFIPETSVRFLLKEKGLDRNATPLTLEPQLADRAVVSRPLVSTELPPHHSTTLLISTPLWVRLRSGASQLAELPTTRLSDTWFGPNTRHGELCYAAQTRARLRLENAPESPFRALTPVTITNSGDDNLKLDRINVPVTHLSLYCDEQRFWTSAITLTRERNLINAQVQIDAQAPALCRDARKVAEPRRPVRGGVLERAADLLFA